MLKMDLEYKEGILFVRLKGILNRKSTYKINNYLNPVLKKHKIKYLVYNLDSLNDIDRTGIDALLNSKIEMKHNKGKMVFCKTNKDLISKLKGLRIPKINNEQEAFNLIEV